MRFWPVPQSYSKTLQKSCKNICRFKEKDYYIDEKHRKMLIWHSGIDLCCPVGSRVLAAEDCTVVKIWKFTGPPETPEYRKTWAVNVRNGDGRIAVYGEVRKPKLRIGQKIRAGRIMGRIAQVIYSRNRTQRKWRCMLHFELYKKGTRKTIDWWPRSRPKPANLLDPTKYLEGCKR